MQRCDLSLWNEGDTYRSPSSTIVDAVKSGLSQIEDEPQMSQQASHRETNHNSNNMLIEHSADSNMLAEQFNDGRQQYQLLSSGMLLNDNVNSSNTTSVAVVTNDRPFVNAPFGLFPTPLGHAAKLSQISRLKTKFKFLGKFMAKAIMDSRMVRHPFFMKHIFNKKDTFDFSKLVIKKNNKLSLSILHCSWTFRSPFRSIGGC